LRRVTLQNAQIKSLSAIDLKWSDSGIWTVKAEWVSDFYIDEIYDNNFAIGGNAFLAGYP
jgi:hypothetical protein